MNKAYGQEPFEKFDLTIDELVLESSTATDGPRVAEFLERELTTLLASRGIPAGATREVEIDSMRIDPPDPLPAPNPRTTGQRLASAIYGGLEK